MSKFIRMLSLSLMIWLCFNVPVFATDLDIIDNMYIELQAKINNDIRATEFDCDDEITKGLTPFKEKREVVIDLTNDLSAVKKSCFEPITIFEEVIIRTYNLPKDDVIKSSTYEQRIVNTSRTYNGVTTTVNSTITTMWLTNRVYANNTRFRSYYIVAMEKSNWRKLEI